MRLIDVDKAIEDLKQFIKDYNLENLAMVLKIITILQEQPTAYDVDKVVAQMKKTSFYVELTDGYSWDGVCVELKKAIDIVKAGGIDVQRTHERIRKKI